jgi:membrane-associated phospholipid phosphatase
MDPILYWNDVALEANRVSHTDLKDTATLGPPLSARALAIVHLAMYDAYAGARGNPPNLLAYLPGLPAAPPGTSAAAAVAGAAHATLSRLFPSQTAFFGTRLAAAGLSGPGVDDGLGFGHLVALRMLAERANDPGAGSDGYVPSLAPGRHRPDPDNPDQGFHAPFYGARSKGFAINMRHELLSPPAPGSAGYQTALDQVRRLGIAPELQGTLPAGVVGRTAEQTLIGIYWGYDGAAGLGTPPRLYNQIVRQVAIARANTTDQNARLFALVNVAMADAGILAWDQKYVPQHDFWRPVVGIREHDLGSGGDPFWLPLGAPKTNAPGPGSKNFTPPFPAYPSGHATFGAAALHITRRFYGIAAGDRAPDTLCQDAAGNPIAFVSDELNGVNKDNKGAVRPLRPRTFPGGLWAMIIQNGLSRLYLGVHWVFDAFAVDAAGNPDLGTNRGGVPLGITIANDIFDTGMELSVVPPRM